MITNYIKRVSKVQAGQLLHTQALTDIRTLLEKAQDQAIGQQRLVINSRLSVQAGYQFIAELDAVETRQERQSVVTKWSFISALNQ